MHICCGKPLVVGIPYGGGGGEGGGGGGEGGGGVVVERVGVGVGAVISLGSGLIMDLH